MASNGANENSEKLAGVIRTADVVNILNFDLEESIDLLLKAAADALGAEAASILVRKDDAGDLIFLKATGKVADQLEGVEVPAGKGVAGFVAVSGQPMAIGDAASEEAFYAEIDKKTGFSTEILLATPLFFNGEILGVLEFINRTGDPPYAPFTPDEMDDAAIYADAIAALVNSFLATNLSNSFAERMSSGAGNKSVEQIGRIIDSIRGNKEHKELLELAVLLNTISGRGESHRKLCKELLESLIHFKGD